MGIELDVVLIRGLCQGGIGPFLCVCPAGHTYLEAKVLYRPERFLSISKDKWGGYQDVQLKGAKWFKKPVGT
jgi:hypothetical protein